MNSITKIGNLKEITINADDSKFSTIKEKGTTISLSLEDYYGNTVQGFLLSATNNKEIHIKDTFYLKDDISKEISDYGVKAEYKDGFIVIHYLDKVLDVADVTIDDLFEADYPELENLRCIRLQLSNINLYEVVIAKTETKAGIVYVYASNEDDAEKIVGKNLTKHLDVLDSTKKLSTINHEEEVNHVYTTNANSANHHTFIKDEVMYKKETLLDNKITIRNIDLNPNRDFLLNHLQELQANFEDLSDDEIIENRDCMLNRINECLKAIFETDNDNL